MRIICHKCGLHKFRRGIVVGRGSIPADILFIGEAPGKSEDLRGQPFIGMSGRLLNQAIERAATITGIENIPTYYITNTILCRPTNLKFGDNRQPSLEEIDACRPNIERIFKAVKPKWIILLGKVAERHYGKRFEGATTLRHPAYLLRQGGVASPDFLEFKTKLIEVFQQLSKEESYV